MCTSNTGAAMKCAQTKCKDTLHITRIKICLIACSENNRNQCLILCKMLKVFLLVISGGQLYTVQVDVKDSPTFFIGDEHESRVVERLCHFNVNGVKGWGAAEWQYRNLNRHII